MTSVDNKTNLNLTAKNFWNHFIKIESRLCSNIKKRNIVEYNQTINLIADILKKLSIENMVNIQFGIDTRNGMNLPERKNSIEMILSPIYQRNNQQLIYELYNESFNYKLPEYWSVIKYKFHRSSFIHSVILNYDKKTQISDDKKSLENGESCIKNMEITKDDFSYFPIVNDNKTSLNILLFIKDDKQKYLINKKSIKVNDTIRELWVPIDNGIHTMMDCAVGEYNLLNLFDKIEIHLESDLLTEEFKNIDSIKIENLINDIDTIHNNSINSFQKCSRCEYSNKNIKLQLCKCKNVYYCDIICQKAHRKLHKLGGCMISN
jgi:hypothetical protein